MTSIPLHPMLVHFPVAFYFLELLLLILWAVKHDPGYRRFALFSFRLGYLFMIVAIIAGYVDAGGRGVFGLGEFINRLTWGNMLKIRLHVFAATGVFILYTTRAFFWRWGREESRSYRTIQILGALVGYCLVILTGYFGGILVFG